MPRWRPLPEELDPQIREFTSQLRRLVDRSGMSVASIADSTGYSKSSWEKYLGGRLLPPRGAAHALAEVTNTDIRHIETMWELAERAWSRAEMRHDTTMEAVQVAQARAALGEFWEEPGKGRKRGRGKDKNKDGGQAAGQGQNGDGASADLSAPPSTSALYNDGSAGGRTDASAPPANEDTTLLRRPSPASSNAAASGAAAASGGASGSGASGSGDAKSSPASTRFSGASQGEETTALLRPRTGTGPSDLGRGRQQRVDISSWSSSPRSSAQAPAQAQAQAAPPAAAPAAAPVQAVPAHDPVAASRPALPSAPAISPSGPPKHPCGHGSSGEHGYGDGYGDDYEGGYDGADGDRRSSVGARIAALLVGAVGASAVIAAVVFLVFGGLPGSSDDKAAEPTPGPTSRARDLPAGVKCQGKSCSGQDPEKMGCGGQNVKSGESAFVGPSQVEVRYSEICKAAWGRITGAAQGDGLKISAGGGQVESDKVGSTNDAYTEMVAVNSAEEARACATLAVGTTGCTKADSGDAEEADPEQVDP
jgi:hypothetical protein